MLLFRLLFLSLAALSLAQQDFYSWPHQRVALPNSSIHFRYAGSGPPVLLIHGVPEHSLTWDKIGPILAQSYTVIAVDNRGTGDSSLARDNDYSAAAAAADLKGVLDFLNITQTYVVSHDKGVGIAAALAANNREMVKRMVLSEYALPGFGYEAIEAPAPSWTAYSNWQLAFFSVPEVAEFFLTGREREYLIWYFYHGSYSGNSAIPEAKLVAYTRAIQKPGFLQAAFGYFGSQWRDAAFFNSTIRSQPLSMPALVMVGEASIAAPVDRVLELFGEAVSNATYEIIPKAGHWIGDENPVWFANRVLQFLDLDDGIPASDLSVLADKVTLPSQIAMGAISG